MVSTLSSFQTQLASIMETLMKAAVLEISKLVDVECNVLQSEVTRSRSEIGELRKRLRSMELQPRTSLPQRQMSDDVRTDTGQTVSRSKHDNATAEVHSRTESVSCVKSECGQEEIDNPLDRSRADVLFRDTSTIIYRDHSECRTSMESPQQQCETNQTINMIKKEVHEVEIKRWDNSEDGTHLAHCGEAVSPLTIKDIVDKVSYLDKGSQGNQTARVPSTAESLESKRNISLGNMTINQVVQLSSKTCTSETDNSSFSRPQSLSVSKSIRTCSDTFSGDKRFVCTYCSKRFRCFSQLEVHQRSHTGEKPYRCTLCGKRYTQKGHLYTHQRTHTGEKPYRCLLCGKGFIQKCTLDMHLRSHTGEKPFTCTKCGKGFTKKCNLNKHLSCQSCNS